MPRVLGGVLGVVPRELGLALRALPVAAEIGLDVIERLARVASVVVQAVRVGRAVVVEGRAGAEVRTRLIVLAPIRFLHRRVDHLGDALASQAAHDRAYRRARHGPYGTRDRSGCRARRHAAGRRAEARTYRVRT